MHNLSSLTEHKGHFVAKCHRPYVCKAKRDTPTSVTMKRNEHQTPPKVNNKEMSCCKVIGMNADFLEWKK